jgi:hypothetical protein
MEEGISKAGLELQEDNHILIYILHPSSPAALTDRLTSPAAHIGSDKRKATGTEGILMLRLVLCAGRLGRGLRPKSTAHAAGMLSYKNARGTNSTVTNIQMQQESISLSEYE